MHTDILGPITPNGHKYAIGFVDSFTRYRRVYFMKSRGETIEKIQKIRKFCANVGQPLTLVSDGAKENIANNFNKFARLKGIRLENSAAYTPQENDKIWDVIVGAARCLGDQASLEEKYWTYLLNTAFYLKKCLLSFGNKENPS